MNSWARTFRYRRAHRSSPRGESGQALVELAISLGILTLILVGAGQFGQIAFTSIRVANAAKAGVQYGAQSGFTAEDTTGIQLAAKAAAPNLSGLTVSSSATCICSDGSKATCSDNSACSNSHVIQTVTVNTQYPLKTIVHIPGMSSSITLNGTAVQKCSK